MNTVRSAMITLFNTRGRVSYQIDLTHAGLHQHRVIKGSDSNLVSRKAALQAAAWDEQWARRQSIWERHDAVRQRQELTDEQRLYAEQRTREALDAFDDLRETLAAIVGKDHVIDWNKLKSTANFPDPIPVRSAAPQPPVLKDIPLEPDAYDARYKPKLTLLDKLIRSRAERKVCEANAVFCPRP